MIRHIAVIGNDNRMIYCAEELQKQGFDVSIRDNIANASTYDAIVTVPQIEINIEPKKEQYLFVGKSKITAPNIFLYSTEDAFATTNAILTAEAATTVYIGASSQGFYNSKVLISGFGRIGKSLSRILKQHGADITVSARKNKDIKEIHNLGYTPIETPAIKGRFDVIFNTIPYNVFTKDVIDNTESEYYIELASPPYGISEKSLWPRKTKVIFAGGLPGKVLPVSAGKAIAETVCTIIRERGI